MIGVAPENSKGIPLFIPERLLSWVSLISVTILETVQNQLVGNEPKIERQLKYPNEYRS